LLLAREQPAVCNWIYWVFNSRLFGRADYTMSISNLARAVTVHVRLRNCQPVQRRQSALREDTIAPFGIQRYNP